MLKKLYLVFNPHSGRGQIKNNLLTIIDTFVKAGFEVTVYPTQKKDDAYEQIFKNATNYDIIVVSGGDGTLNEAVNGIMKIPKQKRPPIGYIPTGTANDFASSLNIPKNQIDACVDIIDGKENIIDVGKFKSEYFVYVAAFGAFTDVSYETNQQFKNMFGYAAYFLEGVKRVGSIKSVKMKIFVDGKIIDDEFVFGMVSNTEYIGGIDMGNDDVSLNDGLFEVLLVKMPKNAIEMQITLSDLLRHDKNSTMYINFKTDKIKMVSEKLVSWTIDGEFGGSHKSVEISNKKCAIRVITA